MSAEVTRETFWQIGPVQEAVFWFLSVLAIVVFVYGVYDRIRGYTQGRADPTPRLDDLRELIAATGAELHEMPRNRADSFCCGGGGGGLWYDYDEEPKPSEERLREALEDTAAGDTIEKFVVACPMCMTMYEDGRKTGGHEADIEIVGITELLAEALTEPRAAT